MFVSAGDAAEIGVQTWGKSGGDVGLAVFRAEDDVQVYRGE